MSGETGLVWGGDAFVPSETRITAGRWTAAIRGTELADIAFDGEPLLRALRVVVRDERWGTVEPRLISSTVAETSTGITISLTVSHRQSPVDFEWSGTFDLSTDTSGNGTVTFRFEGSALSDFGENRIGIIVLNPMDDAGRTLTVTRSDGTSYEAPLTPEINPRQPAKDIAGFAWERSGIRAQVEFAGDVFEMEDHRNWTDASFKTYSTPLSEPFPVELTAGDTISQTVTLRASGARAAGTPLSPELSPERLSIDPGTARATLPAIGIGATTASPGAAMNDAIPGSFLLAELALADPMWPIALQRADAEAHAAGIPLDLRLIVSHLDAEAPAAIDAAVRAASVCAAPVARLGAFSTNGHVTHTPLWEALKASVIAHGLQAELVGGSRSQFVELNRRIDELPADLPALTIGVTPQMHSTETEYLSNSIDAQRVVAENTVRFAGRNGPARPVHIGPITLKERFPSVSAYAIPAGEADETAGYGPDRSPDATTDPRQRSRYAAAWTLASIEALSIAGVASLTYFEASGPRGLGSGDEAYPVWHLLDQISAHAGESIATHSGTLPENIAVLPVVGDGRLVVFLSNRGAEARAVTIEVDGIAGMPMAEAVDWAADSESALLLAADPTAFTASIPPASVIRVDVALG